MQPMIQQLQSSIAAKTAAVSKDATKKQAGVAKSIVVAKGNGNGTAFVNEAASAKKLATKAANNATAAAKKVVPDAD